MDKITRYQQFLKEILQDYAKHRPDTTEVVNQIVADDVKGHYYLMRIGWKLGKRIHSCIFHVDILNGKIWVQDDWTEYSIAQELLDRGVSESDIVLAFQPKEVRETTTFAVE
jgi:hypothetical protein